MKYRLHRWGFTSGPKKGTALWGVQAFSDGKWAHCAVTAGGELRPVLFKKNERARRYIERLTAADKSQLHS